MLTKSGSIRRRAFLDWLLKTRQLFRNGQEALR